MQDNIVKKEGEITMKNIIILLIIIGVTIWLIPNEPNNVDMSFYDKHYSCQLTLEQKVACFQGCKFYNDERYFECTNYCDNHYYVDFKLNGDIKSCKYNAG